MYVKRVTKKELCKSLFEGESHTSLSKLLTKHELMITISELNNEALESRVLETFGQSFEITD